MTNHSERTSVRKDVLLAKEILTNMKLAGVAILIGFVSYFIWYTVKEPYYVPKEVMEKELPILEEKLKNNSAFVTVGWIGTSEYDFDTNLNPGNIPYINDIRKSRFLDDIKGKTFQTFFYSLILLIGGRYLFKGFDWVNRTAKEQ